MSNITLQLDGDALREATVQAMLGVLTPEVKAKMLESAVQAILAPSTNSWEKKKSPLELAFERAVEQIAGVEAKRMVEEDIQMRERMKELLRLTADKVLNADMDKLADRMSEAFAASMRKD
jgi:glutamate racemase